MTEEDFQLAARLHDESNRLAEQLTPVQQYMLGQVDKLRNGPLPEKLEAIRSMKESGDESVLPELSGCLKSPELQVRPAALSCRSGLRRQLSLYVNLEKRVLFSVHLVHGDQLPKAKIRDRDSAAPFENRIPNGPVLPVFGASTLVCRD